MEYDPETNSGDSKKQDGESKLAIHRLNLQRTAGTVDAVHSGIHKDDRSADVPTRFQNKQNLGKKILLVSIRAVKNPQPKFGSKFPFQKQTSTDLAGIWVKNLTDLWIRSKQLSSTCPARCHSWPIRSRQDELNASWRGVNER